MARNRNGGSTDDLLRQRMADLNDEKAAIEAKAAPLRDKLNKLLAESEAKKNEARAVREQVREIEGEEIARLNNEISRIARSLGGRAMSDNA